MQNDIPEDLVQEGDALGGVKLTEDNVLIGIKPGLLGSL
jgi:hypothetical protein